jgi:hypothetical protein
MSDRSKRQGALTSIVTHRGPREQGLWTIPEAIDRALSAGEVPRPGLGRQGVGEGVSADGSRSFGGISSNRPLVSAIRVGASTTAARTGFGEEGSGHQVRQGSSSEELLTIRFPLAGRDAPPPPQPTAPTPLGCPPTARPPRRPSRDQDALACVLIPPPSAIRLSPNAEAVRPPRRPRHGWGISKSIRQRPSSR